MLISLAKAQSTQSRAWYPGARGVLGGEPLYPSRSQPATRLAK